MGGASAQPGDPTHRNRPVDVVTGGYRRPIQGTLVWVGAGQRPRGRRRAEAVGPLGTAVGGGWPWGGGGGVAAKAARPTGEELDRRLVWPERRGGGPTPSPVTEEPLTPTETEDDEEKGQEDRTDDGRHRHHQKSPRET